MYTVDSQTLVSQHKPAASFTLQYAEKGASVSNSYPVLTATKAHGPELQIL